MADKKSNTPAASVAFPDHVRWLAQPAIEGELTESSE
jgi:hypothetical protein